MDRERIQFALASAVARKDQIVKGIIDGIYAGLDRAEEITFIRGWAELASPNAIRVNGKLLGAKKIILAVGAKPHQPDIERLEEDGIF